jgi:hypothetical protein
MSQDRGDAEVSQDRGDAGATLLQILEDERVLMTIEEIRHVCKQLVALADDGAEKDTEYWKMQYSALRLTSGGRVVADGEEEEERATAPSKKAQDLCLANRFAQIMLCRLGEERDDVRAVWKHTIRVNFDAFRAWACA